MRMQKKHVSELIKKKKVKRCIYQNKREVNEQFGRKMDQNVSENRKLYLKKLSKVNEGKVKNCSRIKDGNRKLALGEVEVQRIWKEYFEGLYVIYTLEHVAIHICGFARACFYE